MAIALRQLCLVAQALEPRLQELEALFGFARGYVDPGVAQFGLENTLLPVGRNFIEIVASVQLGTAAGRYLERRGGDGGYMVITQASNAEVYRSFRERAKALGIRTAFEVDRPGWQLTQLHPADMEAAFLEMELDGHCDFDGYWHPAGGLEWVSSVRQERVQDFLGATLSCADPTALATRWAQVLDLPAEQRENGSARLRLDNAILEFAPIQDDRGAGLSEIHLRVVDRPAILAVAQSRNLPCTANTLDCAGVRWRLEEGNSP